MMKEEYSQEAMICHLLYLDMPPEDWKKDIFTNNVENDSNNLD